MFARTGLQNGGNIVMFGPGKGNEDIIEVPLRI